MEPAGEIRRLCSRPHTAFCLWQELVVALSHLVVQYESNFCTVALQFIEEEKNYTVPSPANSTGTFFLFSLFISTGPNVDVDDE